MKLRTENSLHDVNIIIGDQVAKVTICPLDATTIQVLLNEHTRGGEIDELSLRRDRFQKTLHDWKGVTDINGTPLKCETANKDSIVEHSPEFVLKVFQATDEILARLNTDKVC